MEKRSVSSVLRRVIHGVLLLGVLALTTVVHAQTLTPETKEKVLKGMEEIILRRAFVTGVDFAKWPEYLAKHREDIDKATEENAFVREVNRALREFGFSHIGLRTPRAVVARTRTTAVGVGVMARKEDEGLRVVAVANSSPAAVSGVQPGDTIVAVDGKTPDSTDVLEGTAGTKLLVKLKKNDGTVKELELERRVFSTVRPETLTWIDEEAVVLRIWTFSYGYSRPNVERLLKEAAGANYLILDLRGNGGGLVTNMRHLLSLLMPDYSTIGTSVTRQMASRYSDETKGDAKDAVAIAKWANAPMRTRDIGLPVFKGKIAVLINRGSASASEITAAALKEGLHSPLVGTRSAGAVLTSLFVKLPEDYGLQYPVSDYISASGIRLEGHPLLPDVEVPLPTPMSGDIAPEKALERLRTEEAKDGKDVKIGRLLDLLFAFPLLPKAA